MAGTCGCSFKAEQRTYECLNWEFSSSVLVISLERR